MHDMRTMIPLLTISLLVAIAGCLQPAFLAWPDNAVKVESLSACRAGLQWNEGVAMADVDDQWHVAAVMERLLARLPGSRYSIVLALDHEV
jgi:hypothetical protein